jgi:uroporphyrinogen decarboxylase
VSKVSQEQLTSMERILAVCNHQIPDRVPFIITSRVFGLKQAGAFYEQAYKDPDLYVKSQLALLETYRLDAVYDIWCTPAVDDALGASMEIPEDNPPWVPKGCVKNVSDVEKLEKVNPHRDGYMPYMLEINSRLKKAVGPNVPVIAWISQPFRTACMLRGSADLYLDMYDEPETVKRLLDVSLEALIDYGKALLDAGADFITTSNPQANTDCISRAHYEEFSHPYTKKLFGELKAYGAKAIIYHTCGDWSDRYDLVTDENIDIVHHDKVDIKDWKEEFSEKAVSMGNVKSVTTLYQGTHEQVRTESLECLKKGAPGGRFILSADCEAPRDTPAANIQAMAETLWQYGTYPVQF